MQKELGSILVREELLIRYAKLQQVDRTLA